MLSRRLFSQAIRPGLLRATSRCSVAPRFYSTANATKEKKPSLWQVVKNGSTFTFSAGLIVGGIGLAAMVIYLVVCELVLPSGDAQIFNRAVSLVEKDEYAMSLLHAENGERLKAFGELLTGDNWTRNRPIQSNRKVDANGKEHYYMRFHVETKQKMGLVHLEAADSDNKYQPQFTKMYLDVRGEKRYYLVKPAEVVRPRNTGFLGVKWGPKKDE